MPSDDRTTLAELRREMARFVAERDWQQYHAPKNLAMSLAIEAAELMEHFQWLDVEQSRRAAADPQQRRAVADEMADVACYLFSLANALDIDLSDAVRDKLARNALKYPADQFLGRHGRWDQGQ